MKKLFLIAMSAFIFNLYAEDEAVTFLKKLEGSVITGKNHIVYDDANPKVKWNGKETFAQFKKRCSGKPTIGYGFTSKELVEKCSITQKSADSELNRLVKIYRKNIYKYIKVKLNKNQEMALITFAYNVGMSNFASSTLVKKINKKDFSSASLEFVRWKYVTVKGKKVISKGLLNRRIKEKMKFLSK